MDLQQYAALAPAQRLGLLLGQLGSDSLGADLAQHVVPFLSRLGSAGAGAGAASFFVFTAKSSTAFFCGTGSTGTGATTG